MAEPSSGEGDNAFSRSPSLEYVDSNIEGFLTAQVPAGASSVEAHFAPQPLSLPAQVQQVSFETDNIVAPGPAGAEDIELFGPEPDDQPQDDYSPPFGAYLPHANNEQVTESLHVFTASLSTFAAFLTELRVIARIRTLAGNAESFDNSITPMFNSICALVNQWNTTIDNEVRVRTPIRGPARPQPVHPSSPAVAPTSAPPSSSSRSVSPATAARRAMGIGGVPTHHTVQTTLSFTSLHPAPPPISTATRPPAITYAQVAKNGRPQNAILDTATMLTTAMPDAPVATIFNMASRMAPTHPTNRAIPKHAPRDVSKVITVKPAEGTNVIVSQIPNDQALLSGFVVNYEEAKMDERIAHDAPDVLLVRWINNTLHIQFRTSPVDGTEAVVESFWRECPGLKSAQPVVSKFHFRNGVLYRRVLFADPASANSPALIEQIRTSLLSQPAYEGITLVGNPHVQIAEGSTFGNVFVDFHDSSTS